MDVEVDNPSQAPEGSEPVFIVLAVLSWALALVLSAIVVKERHKFPLNGRAVSFVVAFVLIAAATQTLEILPPIVSPFPCGAVAIDKAIDILICMAGVARLFRLYANLKVSQDRLQVHRQREADSADDEGQSPSEQAAGGDVGPTLTDSQGSNVENSPEQAELTESVLKWSKLARTAYISKIFIVVFLVEAIIFLPILFAVDTCENVASDDAVLEYFVLLNFFLALVILVTLAWKVHKLPSDGYFIVKELKYIAVVAIVAAINQIVFIVIGDTYIAHLINWLCVFIINVVVFEFTVGVMYAFSVIDPRTWFAPRASEEVADAPAAAADIELAQDVDAENLERIDAAGSDPTAGEEKSVPELEDVLTSEGHKDTLRQFEEHLASEFAIENLAFWVLAKRFVEIYASLSPKQASEVAVQIFCDFIAVGSANEINISANARLAIQQDLHLKKSSQPKISNTPHMFAGIGQNANNAANDAKGGDSVSREDGSRQSSRSTSVKGATGVPKDIFEEGRRQVFLLMKRDSYPRFVKLRRRRAEELAPLSA